MHVFIFIRYKREGDKTNGGSSAVIHLGHTETDGIKKMRKIKRKSNLFDRFL